MQIYVFAIGLIWVAFIVVWGAMALSSKRTLSYGWMRLWWLRLLAVIVILAVARYDVIHGHAASSLTGAINNPALNMLGVLLAALGVGFAIWARLYLGRNWGMPMSVKEHPELVTSGPYRFVRHPIYTGVITGMLGTAFVNSWWVVVFVAAFAYFFFSARQEEALMLSQFPDTYPAYKARTNMLIPFIF